MLPSTISARLRVLMLGLTALLVAGLTQAGVTVVPRDGWVHLPGAAVQAHAAGGACGGATWFDNPGTVYDNGDYRAVAGGVFNDNWQQKRTNLNVDIRSWRYTSTGNDGWPAGLCLRQERYSGWVADGSYGSVYLSYSLSICGSTWLTGATGWNFEGGHEVYSGWFNYSGCGGPNGAATFRGKNADWLPFYPGEVPAAWVSLG